MQISGPLPVNALQSVGKTELDLRPSQRITAEVLEVSPTRAVLSVEGFPVVARLASMEQAMALIGHKTAQFVVTGKQGQQITLKLISTDQVKAGGEPAVIAGASLRGDLVMKMLEEYGLPATRDNQVIAEAAFRQRLPLTPELLEELSKALAGLGDWGENEANLAAAIKAAGLPLSAESLALAARPTANLGDALAGLIGALREQAGKTQLDPLLRSLIEASLKTLGEAVIDAQMPAELLAKKLAGAVGLLGQSIEHTLKEQAGQASPFWPEKSLVVLLRLQQVAAQSGSHEVSEHVAQVMQDIHQTQWGNVRSEQPAQWGKWCDAAFLMNVPGRAPESQDFPSRFRVERQWKEHQWTVDPACTHLVIQVDVAEGKTVQVELSLDEAPALHGGQRQVKASVTLPDSDLRAAAEEELPSFTRRIEELGYLMKDADIAVGRPSGPAKPLGTPFHPEPFLAVDVEI